MDASSDHSKVIPLFPIFRGLESDAGALAELSRHMKPETFQIRDYIINESHSDNRMFFLLSGQVVINKMDSQGQIVVLGRAEAASHPYFGESILLGKFKKSANVIAHSKCQCLSLSAKDFDHFLVTHPSAVASIYRNIASILFDRISKSNQDLMIQGLLSKRPALQDLSLMEMNLTGPMDGG
jgi:CRP-like cAMP-binding protein